MDLPATGIPSGFQGQGGEDVKELTEQERLEAKTLLLDGHSYHDLSSKSDAMVVERKAGRPRAIPEERVPGVLALHNQGLGYRAIARELRREGILVDWSTIRRIIKTHMGLDDPSEHPYFDF